VLGAIKLAKFLRLGPGDNGCDHRNDGFDRYNSVLEELNSRYLELAPQVLNRWTRDIFLGATDELVFDFRKPSAKEQLFKQKENDWLKFGYSKQFSTPCATSLSGMHSMQRWASITGKFSPRGSLNRRSSAMFKFALKPEVSYCSSG